MSRIKSLDALKGIAVCAVVVIHSHDTATIASETLAWKVLDQTCRFAVPVFFIIAGYFFMRGFSQKPDRNAFGLHYALRIIKPFLFWALFYAVIPPFIEGAPNGNGNAIIAHLQKIVHHPKSFLMTGFAYHLWFFSSLLQAAAITWLALRLGELRIALVLGILLYGAALLGDSYSQTPLGIHSLTDTKNGPFVSTIYFALGACLQKYSRNYSLSFGLTLLFGGWALHLVEAASLQYFYARPMVNNGYLIGTIPFALGAFVTALSRPNIKFFPVKVGVYSLGIFALHPYVIEVLGVLTVQQMFANIPFLFAIVVILITFAVVSLLNKIRTFRQFVV